MNPHDLNGQQILSLVCLPIPPHSHHKLEDEMHNTH